MKNTFKRALVITMAVIIGAMASYGWIEITTAVNDISRSVHIGVSADAQGKLLVGASKAEMGETGLAVDGSVELLPCTSTGGVKFYDEEGNDVSDNIEYVDSNSFFIQSTSPEFKVLSVEGITLSGEGAEDAINKAICVAVEYGGTTRIFKADGTVDDSLKAYDLAVTSKNPTTINVKTWYEGTSEDMTMDNVADATGDVSVGVVLRLDK